MANPSQGLRPEIYLETIDSVAGLEEFTPEWSRFSTGAGATPFQTPEWLGCW